MPDFAINPPIHTTEHILRSTEQAAAFVRQFETVTSIETRQLGRMLKDVNSEGEAQLAVRALKSCKTGKTESGLGLGKVASRSWISWNKAGFHGAGICSLGGAYCGERRRRHAFNRGGHPRRDLLLSPLRGTLCGDAFAASSE